MSRNGATPNLIAEAMRQHSSGDLTKADGLYRQALVENPQNAVALHWRGVIALQTGQPETAARQIEAALALAPDYTEARINLGNVYQALGKLHKAIDCFKSALKADGSSAMWHANLGNAYFQAKEYPLAIDSYRAALRIDGTLAEPQRNLAMALLRAGKISEALTAIEAAARRYPQSVEIAFSHGIILQESGRTTEALELFSNLEKHLPASAPLLNNLGGALKDCGQLERACDYFQRALAVDPAFSEALINLGMLYRERGERDKAEHTLRTAIRHYPAAGKAHHLLSGLKKHASIDADIEAMQMQKRLNAGTKLDLAYLNFGLGKAYEDLENYAEAFHCFKAGNDLYRSTFEYDLNADGAIFDRIKALFTPAFVAATAGAQTDSQVPIFIIGMPRSGTTLVEQILDSHPQVFGGGELNTLPTSLSLLCGLDQGVDYTRGFARLSNIDRRAIGSRYIEQLQRLAPDARRIVDKLPMNFLNVGVIRAVLPRARIIHCCRDPVDTCWSIYKNVLSEQGHSYSYDLAELGRFYRHYQSLMEHWEQLYPHAIIQIDYEQLVTDQEGQTRRLIEACDLPWDDACLNFHINRRTVQTISSEQVRRPLYSSSVKLSRHYIHELAPLLNALSS